jgi:hypothetical protein
MSLLILSLARLTFNSVNAMRRIVFIFSFFIALLTWGAPAIVLAADVSGATTGVAEAKRDPNCPPGTPPGQTCLKNPLGKTTDANQLIGTLIKAALGVVGSLTLLMIVLGGFRWLTAAGNAEQIESGTKTIVWAVIGLFLVFASYLLLSTFTTFLTTGNV